MKDISHWCFAIQGAIKNMVETNFRKYLHNWPILSGFVGQVFIGNHNVIFFLKDDLRAIPLIGQKDLKEIDQNQEIESQRYIDKTNSSLIRNKLKQILNIRKQDVLIILPRKDNIESFKELKNYFDDFSEEDKEIWHSQMMETINNHCEFLEIVDFAIPKGYEFLKEELKEFFIDNPDYNSNIFIMCRFDKHDDKLKRCVSALRAILADEFHLKGLLAEDKMYMKDGNFWNNVCVYMTGCSRGIGLLENFKTNEFNPCVATEYGFLRALDKKTLILKEKQFTNIDRADYLGIFWGEFNYDNLEGDIKRVIRDWLR